MMRMVTNFDCLGWKLPEKARIRTSKSNSPEQRTKAQHVKTIRSNRCRHRLRAAGTGSWNPLKDSTSKTGPV